MIPNVRSFIRRYRAAAATLFALSVTCTIAVRALAATPIALPVLQSPDIAEGAKLFVAYNCADCHGASASGSMAPSLADGRFKFGESPEEISRSITFGRAGGMPAWGGMIDKRQVDVLVRYVRSLSAGKDVSTENFTGETVERTGH